MSGRVALVTGAGVRVGRAIAEMLGQAGAKVAVHYARSASGAAATVRTIAAIPGGRARSFPADLRDPGAAAQLVRDVVDWGGRLDVLVCSAAGFDRRPFEAIDRAAWRDMLALNLEAPFFLAQAAAPALRRRRGVIVNILDVAAFHAWKGYAHYAAAKAGLAMLTRVLALELAPQVRVCGVAPGTVAFPSDYPASDRARVLSRIPLGRVGRPADIAGAVRFLCSASYITGSVIAVDGGRMAGSGGVL
ncbi:MAG: SDR family oxidoreductase [Deltaproteobacteria bacterium]|nr:SDR family oxidoreductase [Deltaproteobacteria bacterium]